MSDSREQILSRVRGALAPLPKRAALPDWEDELSRQRPSEEGVDLWARFSERLRAVNGTPLADPSELVALLRKNGWLHGYCDPRVWPRLSAAFSSEFTVETVFERSRCDDYHFGITVASGAIAETGTLILTDRDTSSRLGALAPWLHAAVVSRSTLVADLPTALETMRPDPNVIWVTGPSKTADVEGILIEGVHGPGVQVALLLD